MRQGMRKGNDMKIMRHRRIDVNAGITPLIDIVFLLLIFFVLSYHVAINPGIKLTLPETASAQDHQEDNIIVFITKDKNIYVNEESVHFDDLFKKLETVITSVEEKTVIIKADEEIDLGLAVKIMDITKQAGAKGLVISTQTKDNVQ